MRGEFVALDLETTGLDSKLDAIIEFGAVRFCDGKVIAEYSTLINPGRPIPAEVTALTGIRNEDFLAKLRKPGEPQQPAAPHLAQALAGIRAFVGDAHIVGHNVGFDLSFLYPHGLFQNNPWVDTYDLAAILIPSATRYSLSSLAKQLGIELNEAHRALNDARASAMLYWAMWEKTLKLPPGLVREIVNLSQDINWNARVVFEYALENLSHAANGTNEQPLRFYFADIKSLAEVKDSNPEIGKPDSLESIFGENGTLSKVFHDYEIRPQQIEMAQKISQVFEANNHLIIEAGTGIGKSLAYLAPAILWATKTGQRVVVSSNTLNLQDQLLENDIPILEKALKTPFQATVLKGKSNYLCPVRLTEMRRRRPTSTDELRVLAKVLVWLTEGGSGLKSELNLRAFVEQSVWQGLSADAENCTDDQCEAITQGTCPFHRARQAARAARVVIVNHALLLADAVSENDVIPDYDHLIIDEAHHLEEAITNSFATRIEESGIRYQLGRLAGNKHSLLNELIGSLETHVPPQDNKRIVEYLGNFRNATIATETHFANFFSSLRILTALPGVEGNIHTRVTPDLRRKAEFAAVERQWIIIQEFITAIEDGLKRLLSAFGRLKQYSIPTLDADANSIASNVHYFEKIRTTLDAIIKNPDDDTVYWLYHNPNYGVSINTAPLNVGKLVEQYLWQGKQSVVITSATLRTGGSFDYLQNMLRAEHIETLALASPFDYRQSTLVFIPNDMPDPNERTRYQQAVERVLVELSAALGGRTLALFTSYTQLQQTAQSIRPRLALGDITVYDQLDSSNRQALLESFKTTEKAVLLGTKSFWEGVDVPGSALSAVVLTKLPFPIPTDPVVAARSDLYDDPFNDYTIPETILRFRQGFGRLIRKQTDRGVVVLLDKRLMSKSYGQAFLDSLPDCTVQYGTLSTLANAATKWVQKDS